ncbi:MAG: DUF2911 domain-containing protein [Cytophagales bacterium]
MKKLILIIAAFVAFQSFSQINAPITSPPSTVTQKVGIIDVKVEYNRPSVKGRKIFGDLLPFGKPWRTGANSPTKITFSDSVIISGKKIAGGTYALYSIPNAKEWTIIFGKKTNVNADNHKEEDDAIRFNVPVETVAYLTESFAFGFENLGKFSADLVLKWENTAVRFGIENDADSKIMADIKSKTDNTDTFWAAANYYFDNGKDLKQALEWANKVIEKNPKFWTIHLKAKILAKMGDCKAAVEAAKKSFDMAKTEKNDDYVKMNEKLIADCKPATSK